MVKGYKHPKTKIEELLTAKVIYKAYKEDFDNGDRFVRQHAYESFFGKPVVKTENDNTHNFPQGIEIVLTKEKSGQA